MNHHRSNTLFTLLISTGLAAAPGCYDGASPAGDDDQATTGSGDVSQGSTGATGTPGDDDGSTGDDAETGSADETGDAPGEVSCADGLVHVGMSPLRRLTRAEYVNTVRDLLGDPSLEVGLDVSDSRNGSGFNANTVGADQGAVEDYLGSADALAALAAGDKLASLTACDVADKPCVQGFLLELARKAFRRPLTDAERDDITALHDELFVAPNERAALETTLAEILSSGSFLYHVEVGEPSEDAPGAMRLTDHELASRLSYFLWQSMPDAELLAAADAGDLHTPETLRAQVERMLASESFSRAASRFHEEWLELDEKLDEVHKDPDKFPQWSPALEDAMLKEVRKFANYVLTEDDARLATLFTAPYTFVNAPLAALYGVEAPESGFALVDTNPEERRGILATGAFLAAHAHGSDPSWVQRGLFVRTRVLCGVIPPPPPDVDMTNLNNPDRTENPECSGCHTMMDPIGWGLDNYDAIGGFALLDGEVVQGEIKGFPQDVVGEFKGLGELSQRLADSASVHDCMARQWFRYATRRLEDAGADKCTIDALSAAFQESGGDIRALLVDIALSDGFRHFTPAQ